MASAQITSIDNRNQAKPQPSQAAIKPARARQASQAASTDICFVGFVGFSTTCPRSNVSWQRSWNHHTRLL
jgi:hypothetical protein